ncbi:epididymis-specific alpha-mannosidase isoform X1 [Lampetra planeri]
MFPGSPFAAWPWTRLLVLCTACLLVHSVEAELEVFVVPHSHMDVGWVYTVQESMHAYAANVYSTVVQELLKAPERRFIAVEQEFFRLWWDGVASAEQKQQVHELVKQGRLEFIIGGQVMHDEAVTELSAQILQLTEGHGFLYETFGVRPTFSWHVDPFGASAATPSLFAMAGFNAHLISRIDYDAKDAMQQSQKLQFVWRGSRSLGARQEIFTHVMDEYSYCTPSALPFSNRSGFYWNGVALFPDPPADGIYPNMSLPVTADTVKPYADTMVANIRQRAAWFRTNTLLWPWGCDKQFFNASVQFDNMDPLMAHVNAHSQEHGVRLRYATLGEFFSSVQAAGLRWDVRDERDFLPYSSDWQSAWTGFYASRNTLKGLARGAQAVLHAAETLFTLYVRSGLASSQDELLVLEQLRRLRWASAQVQHHDAVTGTESPPVRDMYARDLADGVAGVTPALASMLSTLVPGLPPPSGMRLLSPILQLRAAVLRKGSTVVVYNPLGWEVVSFINLTVSSPKVAVWDQHGRPVPTQVYPSAASDKDFSVYFPVRLDPLGISSFRVQVSSASLKSTGRAAVGPNAPAGFPTSVTAPLSFPRRSHPGEVRLAERPNLIAVENKCYVLMFDKDTNLLHSVTDKVSTQTVLVTQRFLEYRSQTNVTVGQPSDNYIFSPLGPATDVSRFVSMEVVRGPLLTEVRQYFYGEDSSPPGSHRHAVLTRLHDAPGGSAGAGDLSCRRLEQELWVGPLAMDREAVLRTSTGLRTGRVLHTDNNGFQMQRRLYRKFPKNELPRNYYPLVRTAFIEEVMEHGMRLTVHSERSHGVASLHDGEMEVMVHRRMWNNENHDYNLTLNDTSLVRPLFWLVLARKSDGVLLYQRMGLQLENRPLVLVGETPELGVVPVGRATALPTLPPNVHLLSLQLPGWSYSSDHQKHLKRLRRHKAEGAANSTAHGPNLGRVLLRLQHLYEEGEDPVLSQTATIDLKILLASLGIVRHVEERSLTGTWDVAQLHRWQWNVTAQASAEAAHEERMVHDDFIITIFPKEIRTFFVHFESII